MTEWVVLLTIGEGAITLHIKQYYHTVTMYELKVI